MDLTQNLAEVTPDAPETTEIIEYGIAYLKGEEIPVDMMSGKADREDVFENYCDICGADTRVKKYWDDRDPQGCGPVQACASCAAAPQNVGHFTEDAPAAR